MILDLVFKITTLIQDRLRVQGKHLTFYTEFVCKLFILTLIIKEKRIKYTDLYKRFYKQQKNEKSGN